MATKTQEPQPQKGLTFDDVWAMFQETARQQKETDKKFQETAEQIKELSKQMGGLHRSFGDLAEYPLASNLVTKFRELHYVFTQSAHEVKFQDSNGSTLTEVDVWLENEDYVMAVEIKEKLLKRDVDEHLQRMAILQGYGSDHGDKRKLLGAVAGGILRKDARDYAIKSGFYVIEQSGDTLKIEMPKGFKPKTW
jgi:hypothetical protein